MPVTAPGDLSAQVLRLLERDNTWTGLQDFTVDSDGSGGIKLTAGAPTVTTDKLYSVGGVLHWSGAPIANPAGAGTVTSVALTVPGILTVVGSPVVAAGTLAVSLATQAANLVFVGPAAGAAAVPTFRALVLADLPVYGPGGLTWAQVSKSGSSLADLDTRSAADLTTGLLALARLTDGAVNVPLVGNGGAGPQYAALNLGGAGATGTIAAARMPALTGDVTSTAGTVATALSTTGVGAGTYGSATAVPILTIDSKGRITSASTASLLASVSPAVISGGSRGGLLVAGVGGVYGAVNPSANGQFLRYNGVDTVWSLDGSLLTGLNATQLTTGVVAVARGGTGLTAVPSNGQIPIGNGAGYVHNTLTGTANQVVVTNGPGTATLSLPQSIATSSTPQFARGGFGAGADGVAALYSFGPFKRRLVAIGTTGATLTINLDEADLQSLTLGANCTITLSAPVAGVVYRLFITQDGAGTRTITWPTIRWRGAVAPTLTVTAGRTDVVWLIWDGTSYYGDYALNFG